jgi:hypothetical protein
MTGEPIFDRLDEAWHGLVQHGRQDADGVRHIWENLTRRNHDNETATPAVSLTGKASAMNLSEIYDRFKADVEAEKAKVEEYAQSHLPALAAFAQAAASNPLVAAAMSVVHLPVSYLQDLANLVNDAETKLAAQKQAEADAAAAQQAALDAANPPAPAEPAPADPAADPSAAMA